MNSRTDVRLYGTDGVFEESLTLPGEGFRAHYVYSVGSYIFANGKTAEGIFTTLVYRDRKFLLSQTESKTVRVFPSPAGTLFVSTREGKLEEKSLSGFVTLRTLNIPPPKSMVPGQQPLGLWDKDTLLLIWQSERNLYLLHRESLRLREKLSFDVPGEAHSLLLDLGPKSQPLAPPTREFSTRDQRLVQYYQHRFSRAYLRYFGKMGKGYVVAFDIPEKIGEHVVGSHMGIHFLDGHFLVRGSLLERKCQDIVAQDGKLYLFYLDRSYQEAEIGSEEGLRVFYGLENMRSLDQFQTIFNDLAEMRDREVRPIIEIFSEIGQK